nr:PQ-loop domain-containing transporter [uncultured Ruegeria sp.]
MADLFGYFGGLFLMISFFPQIVKSARSKSMRDISWGLLTATIASALSYEIYAIMLNLTPVIIMNGVFLVSVAIAMAMKWRFDGI